MSARECLPAAVLKRKAVVYVRQSTLAQVHGNLESQRRQYELADVARQYGFRAVEVIDDDLGLSASGAVARPGLPFDVPVRCTRVPFDFSSAVTSIPPPLRWWRWTSKLQSSPRRALSRATKSSTEDEPA